MKDHHPPFSITLFLHPGMELQRYHGTATAETHTKTHTKASCDFLTVDYVTLQMACASQTEWSATKPSTDIFWIFDRWPSPLTGSSGLTVGHLHEVFPVLNSRWWKALYHNPGHARLLLIPPTPTRIRGYLEGRSRLKNLARDIWCPVHSKCHSAVHCFFLCRRNSITEIGKSHRLRYAGESLASDTHRRSQWNLWFHASCTVTPDSN